MKKLVFILIILVTVVRFLNFTNWYGFDYDQEVNAWLATAVVVDHKPILIGPETSTGGMYVGPVFNYIIAAFFAFGKMDPMSGIFLNLLISIFTVASIYFITQKVFGKIAGVFALLIYSLSLNLTNFDRVLWNPTPIPLVSLWLVYFLFRYLVEGRTVFLAATAVCLGIFFQLHFTVIFLVAFVGLALLIFNRRYTRKFFMDLSIAAGIIFIFLVPLIIFDFRHEFLNSKHFVQFFFGHQGAGFNNVLILLPRFSWAIFYNRQSTLFDLIGLIFLIIFVVKTLTGKLTEQNKFSKVILLLFLVPVVALNFYSGQIPSQYLQFVLPFVVIIFAAYLSGLKFIALFFFVVFFILNVPAILRTEIGLSLANKKQAVSYIVNDASAKSFKVDFITSPGLKTGFKYLFWFNGKDLVEDMHVKTDITYKIIIPYGLVKEKDLVAKFGGIGVLKI